VATRRLRSALSTFKSFLDDREFGPVKAELRWLAHACNDARDLDVFADRIAETARTLDPPPAGLPALSKAVEASRAKAAAEVAEAVASERFRALLIDVTAWIETGAWLDDPAGRDRREQPARAFAARALTKRRQRLLKRGDDLKHADDAHRHQVRIQAKKLRYTAEAFASLYPDKAVARFLKALKALQEELGALNDMATAEPLAERLDLPPDAAFAAGELAGVQASDKPRRIQAAARELRKLAKAEPFWR
jgi:CHAD domain-containing protein